MLTNSQLAILKADIEADSVLNAFPNNSDGAFAIAEEYNKNAVPNFIVWRTRVTVAEVKNAVVWTEYIGSTSAAERDAFGLMISNHIVNASDPNIRSGFNDIFGSPQQATTRNNLLALSKRLASRVEKLFAVGAGTDADPATMTFEGVLSYQDVLKARALP